LAPPVRIGFDQRDQEFGVSPQRGVQIVRFRDSRPTASEDVEGEATRQEQSERADALPPATGARCCGDTAASAKPGAKPTVQMLAINPRFRMSFFMINSP
jgi:hypothetical protein